MVRGGPGTFRAVAYNHTQLDPLGKPFPFIRLENRRIRPYLYEMGIIRRSRFVPDRLDESAVLG